jgi:hypothetical protein
MLFWSASSGASKLLNKRKAGESTLNDTNPKRRFILLTKSNWDEPPRLRHQVTELLLSHGHEVYFGERPSGPAASVHRATATVDGPYLFRHTELIHHKLRMNTPLRVLNASWTSRSLRRAFESIVLRPSDVILNFNYDYCFLRDVALDNVVVTLINDDFISSAPAMFQPALYRAQSLTCMTSNAVLCTSPVLKERLLAGPSPELFLPWASQAYVQPVAGRDRNVLLFWGYLGRRIDVEVVKTILTLSKSAMPDLRIRFIGPKDPSGGAMNEIERLPRVEFHDSTPLNQLLLDDVMGCFIPYVTGVPEVDAIVFPNKLFQMLGVGLPMLVTGMPQFLQTEFVFRIEKGLEMDSIEKARRNFDQIQPTIKEFLEDHQPESRYAQLMTAVERAAAIVTQRTVGTRSAPTHSSLP